MPGSTRRASRNGARRFTACRRSHSSSAISSTRRPGVLTPALTISTSTGPSPASAASTSASAAGGAAGGGGGGGGGPPPRRDRAAAEPADRRGDLVGGVRVRGVPDRDVV